MSTDNLAPFLIRIKTAYEKDGIEGARAELDKLDKQTDKSTASTKGLTDQTKNLGSKTSQAAGMVGQLAAGLGAAGGNASKFGGYIGFAGNAISGLSGGIGGLLAVLGAGAISGFIKWQNHVEAAKKVLEEHRKEVIANKLAVEQFANDKLSAYYSNVASAIDEVSAAQDRLNQARAAADSAEKADRMASITLAEKEELNRLKSDDSLGQARTTSKYASQRRDLEQEYAVKDANRSLEKSVRDLDTTMQKSAVAATAEQRASTNAASLDKQISTLNDQINRLYTTNIPMKTPAPLMQSGGQPIQLPAVVDTDSQKKQSDELKKQRDDLVEEFKKTIQTQGAAIKQQEKLSVQVEALAIETEAAKKRMSTVAETGPRINAATDYAEDRSVREMARSGKKDAAVKGPLATPYQDAAKKAAESKEAFASGRAAQLSNSALAELHKEMRTTEAERLKLFRMMQADQKKIIKDVQDLQSNQRRAGSGG